jgi:ORF6N domain
MPAKANIVPTEAISPRILLIRGQRVIIDADLSELYAVTTKALNQAVKRNMDRFPEDFMFRLTAKEKAEVVTNCDHLTKLKFSKSLPFAFTEHGAIQAANTLSSPQAVKMGVYVVRAFVQLRHLLANNRELVSRLDDLEQKTEALAMTQDTFARNTKAQLKQMFDALRELMATPEPIKRPIGFVHPPEKPSDTKGRKK